MQQIIRNFFEDQFRNTSPFFLYKDKQLLKKGKYREYAEEQLNKANKIFMSMAFGIVTCSFYGIMSLIEYGADPNLFDLLIGIGSLAGLVFILFYSAKEYYTIKSSMTMLIRLLDNKESLPSEDHMA